MSAYWAVQVLCFRSPLKLLYSHACSSSSLKNPPFWCLKNLTVVMIFLCCPGELHWCVTLWCFLCINLHLPDVFFIFWNIFLQFFHNSKTNLYKEALFMSWVLQQWNKQIKTTKPTTLFSDALWWFHKETNLLDIKQVNFLTCKNSLVLTAVKLRGRD